MYKSYKITDIHKNTGKKHDCGRCPIALCLLEAHPEFAKISVGHTNIVAVLKNGFKQVANTPDHMSEFMSMYDCGSSDYAGNPQFALAWD